MICCSAFMNRTINEEGFLSDKTKKSIVSYFTNAMESMTYCIMQQLQSNGLSVTMDSPANSDYNSTKSTLIAMTYDVSPKYNEIQAEETHEETGGRVIVP